MESKIINFQAALRLLFSVFSCCATVSGADGVYYNPDIHIVRAEVSSVEISAFDPQIQIAHADIKEVFDGPIELLGRTIKIQTADRLMLGNTNVIYPLLKLGEEGIFVISGNNLNDLFCIQSFGFFLPKDLKLNVIRGREGEFSGFEEMLAKVRHRRGLAEADKDEAAEEPTVNPIPKVAPLNPVSLPEPPASKAPAPVPLEKEPLMSTEGWLTTGAALLLLVTLILKRCGVLK